MRTETRRNRRGNVSVKHAAAPAWSCEASAGRRRRLLLVTAVRAAASLGVFFLLRCTEALFPRLLWRWMTKHEGVIFPPPSFLFFTFFLSLFLLDTIVPTINFSTLLLQWFIKYSYLSISFCLKFKFFKGRNATQCDLIQICFIYIVK